MPIGTVAWRLAPLIPIKRGHNERAADRLLRREHGRFRRIAL